MKRASLLRIFEAAAVILLPIALVGSAFLEAEASAALSLLCVGLALTPFLLSFENKKPRPRDLVPIAVMSVIAALGRTLFSAIPSFQPASAIILITAIAFGQDAGFLTGALTALSSNLLLGQGPWTPWQMYAWGMIGFFGGLLYRAGLFRKRFFLLLFGFISGILFGWFMDLWYVLGFIRPVNLAAFLAAFASSAWMDLIHGISTVLFLLLLEKPWGKKLYRIRQKYGIGPEVKEK